jgi:hypothetical protein
VGAFPGFEEETNLAACRTGGSQFYFSLRVQPSGIAEFERKLITARCEEGMPILQTLTTEAFWPSLKVLMITLFFTLCLRAWALSFLDKIED